MRPADTHWPGFQPWVWLYLYTQGFGLGWNGSAPLALEGVRRAWIFGERHNYPTRHGETVKDGGTQAFGLSLRETTASAK